MSINESKIYYWLSLSSISPRTINKILEQYSPLEFWNDCETILRTTSLGKRDSFKALKQFRNEDYIDSSLAALAKKGIGVATRAGGRFPERLMQREVDPPAVLYYRGDINLLSTRCFAIVGTRHSSQYGENAAKKFAKELSPYFTIVSGLAMGIDGYAQRATLSEGGKTIGVLGSGINCFTPACNESLFEEVCEKGLVITEYPPNRFATKYTFPERNRIISGLSDGVLVVEAKDKSGALITADLANSQNREVYAVPGNIDRTGASGTNALISRGEAKLVMSYKDILHDLNVDFDENNTKNRVATLDNSELKVYNLLQNGGLHADEICLKLGMNIVELTTILTTLELKQVIKKTLASTYCLA